MVKIKTKKEMTLPKLIQWGWENEIRLQSFYGSNQGAEVAFSLGSEVSTEVPIEPEDVFEVEIEEEIDENTVIPRLLEVRNAVPSKKTEWKDLKIFKSYLYGNHSISEIKNEYSVAIYILNDDYTMSLLWKDGEMIDEN